jgi:DNA-binding response OmpR family regulator
MAKGKILVVEDDPNLGQILGEYLEVKGYHTHLDSDGEAAWKTFKKDLFDLCILDIMMPRMDGFTLAAKIREVNQQIPIIFLTAKSMKEDTIRGLKIGADDYVTKPFSMEELLLRIRAVLRRTQKDDGDSLGQKDCEIGKFHFDFETRILRSKNSEQRLTTKESELLKLFCLNRNRTVQRSYALKTVWGDDSYFNARSMDVYIVKLRKILKDDDSVQIVTVHGEGFKLLAPQEENK